MFEHSHEDKTRPEGPGSSETPTLEPYTIYQVFDRLDTP